MNFNVLPLTKLIEQFERLPGIGRKTAQRLAFYVLSLSKENAQDFADAIMDAKNKITYCTICKNLTDKEICLVCDDSKRDRSILCVVEDVKSLIAFERTGEFNGLYHVLHGLISPANGIGPDAIFLKELLVRISNEDIKEVIMATNPTVDGEATALYISKLIKPFGVKVTRLAYGIPVGADLEYADEITLYRSLKGRNEI